MSLPPTGDPATDHSRLWNRTLVPSAGVIAIDPVRSLVGFAAQHPVASAVEVAVESACTRQANNRERASSASSRAAAAW